MGKLIKQQILGVPHVQIQIGTPKTWMPDFLGPVKCGLAKEGWSSWIGWWIGYLLQEKKKKHLWPYKMALVAWFEKRVTHKISWLIIMFPISFHVHFMKSIPPFLDRPGHDLRNRWELLPGSSLCPNHALAGWEPKVLAQTWWRGSVLWPTSQGRFTKRFAFERPGSNSRCLQRAQRSRFLEGTTVVGTWQEFLRREVTSRCVPPRSCHRWRKGQWEHSSSFRGGVRVVAQVQSIAPQGVGSTRSDADGLLSFSTCRENQPKSLCVRF